MVFKPVDTKVSFPALELEVEAGWRADNVVRKALESGDRSRPFIFFEGPPTANGRPGVHHVEARVSKDVVVRYHRLRGEYVIGARGGWDKETAMVTPAGEHAPAMADRAGDRQVPRLTASISRSRQTDPKSSPAASSAMGSVLVSVIPGATLTSRK